MSYLSNEGRSSNRSLVFLQSEKGGASLYDRPGVSSSKANSFPVINYCWRRCGVVNISVITEYSAQNAIREARYIAETFNYILSVGIRACDNIHGEFEGDKVWYA